MQAPGRPVRHLTRLPRRFPELQWGKRRFDHRIAGAI